MMNEYRIKFGNRFRLVRSKMKMSQGDLSKRANLSRNTITNLERFRQVKVTTILRISQALDIAPHIWFLPDREWMFWYDELRKEGS